MNPRSFAEFLLGCILLTPAAHAQIRIHLAGAVSLNDVIYGVTPTIFVKSPDASASLTNLTSQQYRMIAANGAVPQHVFTGNTNETNLVYWIMRDIGAAHRVISSREAGFTGAALAYVNRGSGWVLDPVGQPTWPGILALLHPPAPDAGHAELHGWRGHAGVIQNSNTPLFE